MKFIKDITTHTPFARMVFILVILWFASLSVGFRTANASTPEITKAEAAQILSHMGYENVKVGALIKGVGGVGAGAFSSENMASIVAVGTRNRMSKEISVTIFYDADHGWFYYESVRDELTRQYEVRIWTKDGYKKIEHPEPEPKKKQEEKQSEDDSKE
ncbi:MAG: hypothetical protein MAG551_00395 [Candidatus Scalindua arabica]|uniref:Uncharacterized protein n=1 Tax=Candidatus Scalindua arabica TaxID=1127984 RepID=A0A941ZY08_9BACT|nr:hypothetical protein [Candidatus Scalindua arabica]